FCKKLFTRSADLKVHYRVHTNERPFECNLCRKQFTDSSNMLKHNHPLFSIELVRWKNMTRIFRRNIESLRFLIHCVQVGIVVLRPRNLPISDGMKTHELIHASCKQFVCSFCKKLFTRSADLKVHYRVHTNERPFECNLCRKQFTDSSNMLKHKKRIHAQQTSLQ
ncbi:unnamed protein product, partial [Cyprideis torosa]